MMATLGMVLIAQIRRGKTNPRAEFDDARRPRDSMSSERSSPQANRSAVSNASA